MKTILVVDHDDPVVVRTCTFLRDAGLRVLPARSAAQAVQLCRDHRIDAALIVDAGLASQLKSARPRIKVLLLARERGDKSAGAADHVLHLPLAPETVFAEIVRLLTGPKGKH